MAQDYYLPQVSVAGPLSVACLALVVLAAAWAIGRAVRGGGPAAFAILWFIVAISPVSSIVVPVGIPTAERFLYLPMVGVSLWAGLLLLRLHGIHLRT